MALDASYLVVDLDGTLLQSDLYWESLIRLLAKNPFFVFLLPLWLLKGKANLHHQIARRIDLQVDLLPYHEELISYLGEQKRLGGKIILVSESNISLVNQLADHLNLFEHTLGSTESKLLEGSTKLSKIQNTVGEENFVYIGSKLRDLTIWSQAAKAIVANSSPQLLSALEKQCSIVKIIGRNSNRFQSLIEALRLHQWLKNVLVFVPIALSHQVTNFTLALTVTAGFIAFCLCASSVYLINDLLDLDNDRRHKTKRYRPLANGRLSLATGMLAIPILILIASFLALQTTAEFCLVLAVYFIITLLYNFRLKAVVFVDVIILAGLYTLRIVSGAALIHVFPTFWLLAFSMFLFLSLAMVKRVTELVKLARKDAATTVTHHLGRGYVPTDSTMLAMLGSSSGLMAVLVFALYINDPQTRLLYASPEVLWLICPFLLYLVGRIWLITMRGDLQDDPVVFAISDRRSQLAVALCVGLLWIATNPLM